MSTAEQPSGDARRGAISRRKVLAGMAGTVAAGGAGLLGFGSDVNVAAAAAAPESMRSSAVAPEQAAAVVRNPAAPAFKSRPDLLPPVLQHSVVQSDTAAGLFLLTPSALPTGKGVDVAAQIGAGLGQPGLMIADEQGRVVWFQPTSVLACNLQVQSYDGKPVLTYWEGLESNGIGFGVGHVLDTSYRQIAAVTGGNGLQADLHELQLTPQGTALITAYVKRAADLTAVKGPAKGTVWESVVQEIDLKTGKVLLDWRSLDHVPVSHTYSALTPGPFDYFHVNSVAVYGDDELLVSARNTWALYRINRKTGEVNAHINGRASDYKMSPGTNFYWQHHARQVSPGVVTLFDDGAAPAEEARSRALVLAVDDSARTVRLTKAFSHPANLLTPYEGSVQLLGDDGVVVGWGAQPYFTQFGANGELVFDGRFPTGAQSYRAFRSPWNATPPSLPDVAVAKDSLEQVVVSVSWNGATEVSIWQVLSGRSASTLVPIAAAPKAGFETAITTRPTGTLLAVAALDASGKRLAVSRTVALPG
jgi:hypothetical protein